ncbi:MAG: Precorrin-3B methylase [Verrucomicrobiota bacterium]
MPAKKNRIRDEDLSGTALVKETARRIRAARSLWDAHRNGACRHERDRALSLYNRLSDTEKEKIPQALRVWLRYRSEKYFGPDRTPPTGKTRRKRK